MIKDLPSWIDILFIAISVITIVCFYYANGKAKRLTGLLILWSVIHSIVAFTGFYENTSATPPRFALILVPSTLLIIYGLLPKQQSWFIKVRDMRMSTLLHFIRFPVEIVLFYLFIHKMIPELMTFEGRNYDIVMGITAPIIAFLFLKNKISKYGLFAWNSIGLVLILFILVNGVLSSELPIQQFGFEQPNRAIMYFPYILLPATIVPIVIWTHISDLIILIKGEN